MVDEQPLAGGVGNAGRVVRVGDTVRRPWHPGTPAAHAVLAHLARALPGVAPVPLGRDEQGREVLSWVDGDVAVPPFPRWVTEDRFLVSLGRLLRRVHDALDGWSPPASLPWPRELADPEGGPLVVHGDVCPENVVARDGAAVALLDWEFAAPGRRVWDVVSTARLCVPFVAPDRRDRAYAGQDVDARLRALVDAYGLDERDRGALPEVLEQRRQVGEGFVRGRVAAGEQEFVRRWGGPAGEAKHRRERDWIAEAQARLPSLL